MFGPVSFITCFIKCLDSTVIDVFNWCNDMGKFRSGSITELKAFWMQVAYKCESFVPVHSSLVIKVLIEPDLPDPEVTTDWRFSKSNHSRYLGSVCCGFCAFFGGVSSRA